MATMKKIPWADEVAALSDNAPQDVKVQTASAGVGTAASRDDHKHNVPTGTPGNITENATAAEGTSASLARLDHTHGSPADWTPKAHATSHKAAGGDSIKLNEFANPTAAVEFNKQEAQNLVFHKAASITTPVKGQAYYDTDDDHVYVCTLE